MMMMMMTMMMMVVVVAASKLSVFIAHNMSVRGSFAVTAFLSSLYCLLYHLSVYHRSPSR